MVLSTCLSVCLSVAKIRSLHKKAIFSKTNQPTAIDEQQEVLHGLCKEPILKFKKKFGTQQQIWDSVTVTWPNMNFLKFKMADTRRIENLILAITQQPIARFQWNFAVFHRISAMKQVPTFHRTYFLFSCGVRASVCGGFGIVSDTLVVNCGFRFTSAYK